MMRHTGMSSPHRSAQRLREDTSTQVSPSTQLTVKNRSLRCRKPLIRSAILYCRRKIPTAPRSHRWGSKKMRVVSEDVQGSNEGKTGFDKAMYMSRVERAGRRNMYRYHDSRFSKSFLRLSRVMASLVPSPTRPSKDRLMGSKERERGARAPAFLVTESISLWRA